MARPEKNTVEYFPFICKEGKAMFYIEQKYGNDGYATWIKILRQLAVTNYHYLNLSDATELMFLSAKCRVDEETLLNIILDLSKLGEFDSDMWEKHKVVYCDKFMENIKNVYEKRSNDILSYDQISSNIISLSNPKRSKSNRKPSKSKLEVTVKPQTILDYTIVDKTKLDNTIEDYNENDISKEEEYEFLFNQFWDIYDKKTGKEKSLKEWNKLKESEIETIFKHVEEYVKSTPEKQYRKNPHSYLYNKTFNDEIIKSGKRTIFDRQLEQANKTREFLERNNPFASYDNEN